MPPAQAPTEPDRQLQDLALLRRDLEGIAVFASHPTTAASQSFGLFPNPLANAEQTVSVILASIRQILAQLTPTTRIQTSRDDLTAITVLNYSGTSTSLWTSAPPAYLAEAHLASLQSTLDLRLAVAGVIASAGTALTAISLALTNPLTVASAIQSALTLKHRLESLSHLIAAQRPA